MDPNLLSEKKKKKKMVKFQILNFPRFKFLKINKIWGHVLICCSCYNKGLQATWLKQQKCTVSEF